MFKGSATQSSQSTANVPMINVSITNDFSLVIGTLTLLRQFKSDYRNEFIAILSQYVRSSIVSTNGQKSSDLPAEISKVLNFIEQFIDYSHFDRKVGFNFCFRLDS